MIFVRFLQRLNGLFTGFYIAAQEENHSTYDLAEGLAFNVNGLCEVKLTCEE